MLLGCRTISFAADTMSNTTQIDNILKGVDDSIQEDLAVETGSQNDDIHKLSETDNIQTELPIYGETEEGENIEDIGGIFTEEKNIDEDSSQSEEKIVNEDETNILDDDEDEESTEPDISEDNNFLSEEEMIRYITNHVGKTENEVLRTKDLYDINDLPNYILVEFNDSGYAIARKDCLLVTEHSPDAASPYEEIDGIYYYLGLLQYAYKNSNVGELLSVSDRMQLSEEQINNAAEMDTEYVDIFSSMALKLLDRDISSIAEPVTYAIKNPEKIKNVNFGKNVPEGKYYSGSCGPIADTILMEYFDSTNDDNFIPPNLETTYHEDDRLHSHFKNNVTLTQTDGGSMPVDDARLINHWLGQDETRRNLGYHACYSTGITGGVLDAIRNDGIPGILNIWVSHEGTHNAHVVVAYGYRSVGETNEYLIHPGWHTSCLKDNEKNDTGEMPEIYINTDLVPNGCVWLESYGSHEHNFNVPVMYNGTDILHDDKYHFMKCTSCNLITEQEHTLQPRTFYNSNRHYKECPICNYKTKDCTNISIKSYNNTHHFGYCDKCEIANINKQEHNIVIERANYMSMHEKKCTGCTFSQMESCSFGHIWNKESSAHTKTCSKCGKVLREAHSYIGTYQTSSTEHYRSCLTCLYRQSSPHNFGSYQYNSQSHYKICGTCNYKQSQSHTLLNLGWKTVGTMFECKKLEKNALHVMLY